MNLNQYKQHLKKKSYIFIDNTHVSMGNNVYTIHEEIVNTVRGKRKSFYLTME